MRRLLLLISLIAITANAQTIGSGVRIGNGVTIGGFTAPAPPSSGFIFAPPAGSYTGMGTQNVGITYSPTGSGQNIFYTTDGSTASEASTLLQSGQTVPVSTTATINTVEEKTGTIRQNTQNTQSLWKICTPNGGGPGTPTSVKCGGVGTTQPSAWTILWNQTIGGVSGVESISLSGTTGAPQILVTLGGSGCDSCTKITMDKWIKPLDSDTGIENHEHDAWHNDATRNRLHMIGFQCNQQSGNPAQGGGLAGPQWQVDNEQGGSNPFGSSWWNTNVNDKCPLSTSLWTHIIVHAHWIIGDDGCGDGHTPSVHGGMGCTYYDDFWVGTASSPNATSVTMTKHVLSGYTLENDAKGWSAGCADQDQVDLKSGVHTGGVLIAHNNVTCSFSTVATGSAAYTF
jgi:hypothetical protein